MDGKYWAKVGLCCLLLAAVVVFVQTIGVSSVAQWVHPKVNVSPETEELLRQVHLTRFVIQPRTEVNQVDALFSFENTSEHTVANIDIICEIFDKNDRFLGKRQWLASEPVQKSSKKTFLIADRKMFMPLAAHKVECVIADMGIVDKPLITVHKLKEHLPAEGEETKHSSIGNH